MLQVIYNQARDLTLILNRVDKILLTKEKTINFLDLALRGFCRALEAYVFLAYSRDISGVLYIPRNSSSTANDLERMGRIVIPGPEDKGNPWLIGLSNEGVKFLEDGWPYGIRYNGSNKLFIKVTEEVKK